MRFLTVLNAVEKYKSFVYADARLVGQPKGLSLEVDVLPRSNSKPVCSVCHNPGGVYDKPNHTRRFEYVPLWGIPVFLLYAMRRVNCPTCGVRVEEVPWAMGKCTQTRSLKLFLATWARRLAWQEVASIFGSSWNRVRDAVAWVVDYGLAHRDLSGIEAIGVDEIQQGRGQNYLTLVYQIDPGMRRLIYVARERTAKSLLRFFVDFGKDRSAKLKYVCTDMWAPYLKVIKKKATGALHILDRFHLVANLNKALNEIRAQEARQMRREGYEEILKNTRTCFLKNPDNLTPNQRLTLREVLKYDLKTTRGYFLKKSFQGFWKYTSPAWAQWFLRKWCTRAMRSRLKPIQRFVKSLRKHEPLILNWFRAKKQFSSGVVEGLNRKVNLVTRKSYGFREFSTLKLALFHNLGKLPEPPAAHRFC